MALEKLFPAPLRLAEAGWGEFGEAISRRDWRRNLPFLPGHCQAFLKNITTKWEMIHFRLSLCSPISLSVSAVIRVGSGV
jgi:hypothetical protein